MNNQEMKKAYQLYLICDWRKQVIKSSLLLIVAILLFTLSQYHMLWDFFGVTIIRLIALLLSMIMLFIGLFVKSIKPSTIRKIGIAFVFSMLMLIVVQIHICELFYPDYQHLNYEVSMSIYIGVLLFANPLRDILHKLILITATLNLLFLYRHYNLEGLPMVLPYIVFLCIAYFLSKSINRIQYDNFVAREELSKSNEKLVHLLKLQKEAQEEALEANARDSLTQALNREYGLNYLQKLAIKSRKLKHPLTICFFDLDDLKTINDRFGHKIGDQYIINVIKHIKQHSHHAPIIRLGGDEFIIVFENKSKADIDILMMNASRSISIYNNSNKLSYELSFSYGVAEYKASKYIHIDNFIDDADRLMYLQKTDKKKLRP